MENSKGEIRGFVSEIFCSIQGEGIHVGEKHVFVRTAGCSLGCSYCDTAYSNNRTRYCDVHLPGKKRIENPMSIAEVLEAVNDLQTEYGAAGMVSITGGEPLEQPEFVAAVARKLRAAGLPTYLDTNGVEHEAIEIIAPLFDVISVDFKMPSAVKREYWDEHGRFIAGLKEAELKGKEVFVKIVVSIDTPGDEIVRSASIIAGVDRRIPLVMQPEAAALERGRKEKAELSNKLLSFQTLALEFLETVRIIPQCHRILSLR